VEYPVVSGQLFVQYNTKVWDDCDVCGGVNSECCLDCITEDIVDTDEQGIMNNNPASNPMNIEDLAFYPGSNITLSYLDPLQNQAVQRQFATVQIINSKPHDFIQHVDEGSWVIWENYDVISHYLQFTNGPVAVPDVYVPAGTASRGTRFTVKGQYYYNAKGGLVAGVVSVGPSQESQLTPVWIVLGVVGFLFFMSLALVVGALVIGYLLYRRPRSSIVTYWEPDNEL